MVLRCSLIHVHVAPRGVSQIMEQIQTRIIYSTSRFPSRPTVQHFDPFWCMDLSGKKWSVCLWEHCSAVDEVLTDDELKRLKSETRKRRKLKFQPPCEGTRIRKPLTGDSPEVFTAFAFLFKQWWSSGVRVFWMSHRCGNKRQHI